MGQPKRSADWVEWVNKVDALIRGGGKSAAKRELGLVALNKIPQPLRASVAQLFRRVNLPRQGVRLLSSVVRPTKKNPSESTIEEKAEYAVCLIRIGAVAEGLGLLRPLSSKQCAPVALYRAFAHIAQWDYRASIGELMEYLANPQPNEYERLVAKANLLAALVSEREGAKADKLFGEMIVATNTPTMKLLYGSILELGAQLSLAEKHFDEMSHRIQKVEKLFSGSNDIHLFYANKLRILSQVTQEGATKNSLRKIESLREESIKLQNWETLRECDRIEAKAKQDPLLFDKVFLGTPHLAYRESLLKEFGGEFRAPQSFDWSLSGSIEKRSPCFDTSTGAWSDGKALLKPGQLLHRLLIALASDFYKPQRLATLHSLIFPNEYYNPITSPGRVHRTLGRWRLFSLKAKLKVGVHEVGGMYRLVGMGPVILRVKNLETADRSQYSFHLSQLREAFQNRLFSTSEAANLLGLSRRSTQRTMVEASSQGELLNFGTARSTRYRFKTQ